MLFASIELATRIERAERGLTEAVGRAVVARHVHFSAFVERVSEGIAVFVQPASPMNKMIGVGFGALPDDDKLSSIEARFKKREAPLQVEVSTMANPAFAATLSRRGYVLEGFENVLAMTLEAGADPPDESTAIDVAPMRPDEGDLFLDVAVKGFLSLDAQGVQPAPLPEEESMKRVLKDFTDVAGFHRYIARVGGEVAGVASLRIDEGIAQLCGAATLPAFRRRGVQSALLRRRLDDARREGCDIATMTVQAGSKSHENGQKRGFATMYPRALMVKAP